MKEQRLLSLRNPILRDHRVMGQHVLPGLAYIDLVFQTFRKHGHDFRALELRDLSIYRPLIVAEGRDVQLTIQCSAVGRTRWQIEIEGEVYRDGKATGECSRYARAEMLLSAPAQFDDRIDVGAIRSSAQHVGELAEVYSRYRGLGLVADEFMQAHGTVYIDASAVNVSCELNPLARPSARQLMFHPALIDGSAVALLRDGAGGRLSLPLCYRSFRASELLQLACVARIRTTSIRQRHELSYCTVEFFNEAGAKVAELTDLASKQVRERSPFEPDPLRNGSAGEAVFVPPEGNRPIALRADARREAAADASGVESQLRQLIADRLQRPVEQIDPDAGYYEMGIDSAGLLELVRALEARVGASLPPTLFFEYVTLSQLAAHLTERYAIELSQDDPQEESSLGDVAHAKELTAIGAPEVRPTAAPQEDIAIIGMAGRFPAARSIREFWENLKAGKDCVTEVPAARWDWRALEGLRSPSGKPASRWGGFLDDVDCFDPLFFRISPREAETIDPQERHFLEVCWEAIEDAGYTPRSLVSPAGEHQRMRVGVFAGVMHKDYALIAAERMANGAVIPLSQSTASVANRVSYFCGFHGPSLVIDTMCSSSLVAVHQAIQSIRARDCEVAIAGGVNLSLHPGKYAAYSLMEVYASDGRCRSFGEGGDGYVSGEAVGAVVLKPLGRAIADRDHVWAVIKGSAINHVGTVGGFTVPSQVAQADLLSSCLANAGVPAETVGYIEAHGTGTPLGDPIEIEGLRRAYAGRMNSCACAIGSVKSNVGHAESAAGIVGLIKVALQLHHRTLVPSLHCAELNAHIDWKQTPFFLQRTLQEWTGPQPRRAAISSFGATGANAHLILEEDRRPVSEQAAASPSGPEVVVPLSAMSIERLRDYAARLSECLRAGPLSQWNMADIAFTLQVGRETLASRVAFVVRNGTQLIEELDAFARDESTGRDRRYQGERPRVTGAVDALSVDGDFNELVAHWLAGARIRKLARIWAAGFPIQWSHLYRDASPRRVSLPTYPFARERYWISAPPRSVILGSASAISPTLHPLLQLNTSDLSAQRFTSIFTGDEFFLAEHVVLGDRVLPGVAHLEMAHAAVARAAACDPQDHSITLRDVAWLRPFVVGAQPRTIHIRLLPTTENDITFEIYGDGADTPAASSQETLYSQGRAQIGGRREAAPIDVAQLWARCARTFEPQRCYATFASLGLRYGPAFRCLDRIGRGSDDAGVFAIAKLSLPTSALQSSERHTLHPSLLDSALQASIALTLPEEDTSGANPPGAEALLALPFAVDELNVLRRCPSVAYAVVRRRPGSVGGVQRMDVDVCAEDGTVCVQVRGFSVRNYQREATPGEARPTDATAEAEVMTFEERWERRPLREAPERAVGKLLCLVSEPGHHEEVRRIVSALRPAAELIFISAGSGYARHNAGHYSVLAADSASYRQALLDIRETHGSVDAVWSLCHVEESARASDFRSLFAILQAMSAVPDLSRQWIFAARYRDGLERCYVESWMTLGRSLRRALPDTRISVVGGERRPDQDGQGAAWMQEWIPRLWAEMQHGGSENAFYHDGERTIPLLHRTTPEPAAPVLQRGGTYIVTGGVGGIGLQLSQHLAARYAANLILTGRSALDSAKSRRLDELRAVGGCVSYVQADVCDRGRMSEVVADTIRTYGRIHGVFHTAGVAPTHDDIRSAGFAEFAQDMAAKIDGTLSLDEVLRGEEVDFICGFSSIAAVLGDFGACSYAIGNRFQSAFARLARTGSARKTIAIQWPLWSTGGMHLGTQQATEEYLASSGQQPLDSATALALCERLLGDSRPQPLVMIGRPARILRLLGEAAAPIRQSASTKVSDIEQSASLLAPQWMKARAVHYLKNLFAATLKIPVGRIDPGSPFDAYGIDSISALQLTKELERSLGPLSKTLLFEYGDIESLSDYLGHAHARALSRLLSAEAPDQRTTATVAAAHASSQGPERVAKRPSRLVRPARQAYRPSRVDGDSERDIAIIALAGRYPQARDSGELWKILSSGRDCIAEIPAERWDWRRHFDPQAGRPGKSYCRWGSFIEGVDQFDPLFFQVAPSEATWLDPQVRLALETVWELLESAGYTRKALERKHDRKVGVYFGSMYNHYGLDATVSGERVSAFSTPSAIANRVSHFFDLRGPSMVIDSMCSSAAIAIHTACKDLAREDCGLAIAGGVNLSIHPGKYIGLSQARLLGSHRECRSFAASDGYLPAECVGAILLKPLAAAVRDGDPIHAVIKGMAVRHSGGANAYLAPNPAVQAEVMEECLKNAGVEPQTIGYIEAAASGLPLADASEIAALKRVFRDCEGQRDACVVGAVKSILGHAEAASAIPQIAKTVLQLKHARIAPSLGTGRPGEEVDFGNLPLRFCKEAIDWKRPLVGINGAAAECPRRALINCFGAGGTYVSLVVEEYDEGRSRSGLSDRVAARTDAQIVVLSARNEERLRAVAERMLTYLATHAEAPLEDIAHALQVSREPMSCRLALVADSREQLQGTLRRYVDWGSDGAAAESVPVFSGSITDDAAMREVIAGESGKRFITSLFEAGSLDKLAMLWTRGVDVEWEVLYPHRTPRLVGELPPYPFDRRSYWLSAPESESREAARADTPEAGMIAESAVPAAVRTELSSSILCTHIGAFLERELGVPRNEISDRGDLRRLGLSSLAVLRLLNDIEAAFGIRISVRQTYELRTIAAIAARILETAATAGDVVPDGAGHDDTDALLDLFKRGLIDLESMKTRLERGIVNDLG